MATATTPVRSARMVYQWRSGAPAAAAHLRTDAQRVGEALAAIAAETSGELHAQDVVAAARDERSPLHGFFEWDDRKAARAHRLFQAERLVMAVVVDVPDADRPEPAFIKTYASETPTFTSRERAQLAAVRILGDSTGEDARRSLEHRREKARKLATACGRLKRWQHEFGDLDELKPVIAVIEEQLAALDLCR